MNRFPDDGSRFIKLPGTIYLRFFDGSNRHIAFASWIFA